MAFKEFDCGCHFVDDKGWELCGLHCSLCHSPLTKDHYESTDQRSMRHVDEWKRKAVGLLNEWYRYVTLPTEDSLAKRTQAFLAKQSKYLFPGEKSP